MPLIKAVLILSITNNDVDELNFQQIILSKAKKQLILLKGNCLDIVMHTTLHCRVQAQTL